MDTPDLALNDGRTIPQIGLGTYPLTDDQVREVVVTACARCGDELTEMSTHGWKCRRCADCNTVTLI